jgi:cytochrome P450
MTLQHNPRRDIPTLSGRLPLLGHFLELRRDRLHLQQRLADETGDIAAFTVGPRRVVAVSSAELARQILVEKDASFKKARGLSVFARPLLGNGLLTAERSDHRRQRRLLSPAFAPRRMANYAAIMARESARCARRLAGAGEVDFAEEMARLTLAIVGWTLFDADLEADARAVNDSLTDAMKFIVRATALQMPMRFWRLPIPLAERMRAGVASLDDVVYRMIRERRGSDCDRGDVMSILLTARDTEGDGSGLSDVEIRDQAMTLVLAGHETTANAMAWAHHLLAENPAVYDDLQAEVGTVLGDRPPSLEDLPRLPLSLQVMKEAMRLFPPAYVVARNAIEDVTIGDFDIAKDTIVAVNIYGMHRRGDYFPDPLRFRPERFAPENEKDLKKGAFLPFGGGPRICIGNHFALTEGQIILSTLAARTRMRRTRNTPVRGEPLVTLRPRGLRMRAA